MARFTLLEVHLDGARFTANAPFSGEETSEGGGRSIADRLADEPASEGSGSASMGLVAGFVLLVGAVAIARKYLTGRAGEESDEAELESLLAR